MAKAFNKLRDPKLGMMDILIFGKMRNCRICDIVQEDYEYILWLKKNTSHTFTDEVLQVIKDIQTKIAFDAFVEEEIRPWQNDNPWFSDIEDDIPF